MKILSIETSCDETAIAIIEAHGGHTSLSFDVLSHQLYSQASKHAEYGGVYPTLAKREHAQNLVPLLEKALQEIGNEGKGIEMNSAQIDHVSQLLEREPELLSMIEEKAGLLSLEGIDGIAVTQGPGLEPALWVGINFAKTLSYLWDIPLIPVNHMEGHIFSAYTKGNIPDYPLLSLLVSGGHTELVLSKEPLRYEIIGKTRDDAIGEAYDKVGRMLDLPYPGGPHIARNAHEAREQNIPGVVFPRPMIHSDDLDFSFSGLKTSVLYALKEKGALSKEEVQSFARGFEDAVIDVLISKLSRALDLHNPRSLIIGGGVSANKRLRDKITDLLSGHKECHLYLPSPELSTDNAIMIGIAGYLHRKQKGHDSIRADGNLSLESQD